LARHTTGDRMAAHPKSDQSRACRCAVAPRKRVWNAARSFFSERLRPAVLNVRSVDVIFVKENIVQLPLIVRHLGSGIVWGVP
jgi:hypothetical protein